MLKYHKILVATCLTENSDKIVAHAANIAKPCKASIDIVHVLEQTAAGYGGEFSTLIDVEYEQTLEKNLQKMLGDQAKKFDIPKDRQHFELGPIKHVVVDLAKDLKADLIVVGSHSHHGLERLLGSKANAILHLAQCDVLTVRITE